MTITSFIRDNWKIFLKYAAVGSTGTIIDVAGFTALVQFTPLPRSIAATISFVAAVVNNYTWNRLWTFKSHTRKLGLQFGKFFLVSLGGLALNLLFLSLFSSLIASFLGVLVDNLPSWGNATAKLGASGAVLIYNFIANRFWTFNQKKEKHAPLQTPAMTSPRSENPDDKPIV